MTVHRPTPGQLRVYWLALTGLSVAMLIGLACAVVLGLSRLLDLLSPVLWPLALAAVVACLLSPLVDWMEKRKVPRTRAILLVFVVVFALVAGVLASLIPQVVVETQQLIVKVPEYSNKLQHRIAGVLAHPPEILVRFLPAPVTTGIAGNGTAVNGADPEQALTSALSLLAGHWSGLGTWLFSQSDKVASGFGMVAGLALVPVYAFYFLQEKRRIKGHWKEFLPVRDSALKEEVVFVLDAINGYLVAYFRGQVLVALCDSVLYTIGFLCAGLNYALLLGVAAVLLCMIPFLGAIVLFLAALALAFVQYGDWMHPLIILGVFVVVQSLEGLVISPKIIGNRVGLHPLVIIIAVMTGTTLLGGILGGVLAIPLAAALRVILFRYVWKVRATAHD
jgi:predicted PurR-regulated permease PerM